jgi:hypothetical protein
MPIGCTVLKIDIVRREEFQIGFAFEFSTVVTTKNSTGDTNFFSLEIVDP